MNEAVAIAVQDLDVRFGARPGLIGMEFQVQAGEKVLLCGPSGSGKSTLLAVLLGFIEPNAGSVTVRGTPLNSDSVWNLRRQMAFVPQEPAFGEGSVRDILEQPLRYRANHHLDHSETAYTAFLERFRLPGDTLDKPISSLSGGEKQRVALAAALMLKRSILLVDEITSALDPELTALVADYLAAQDGLTVLAACHTPRSLPIGGRVVSLNGGAS